jgi:hypothetical protein
LTWLAIRNETQEIIGCTSAFPRKIWMEGNVILACGGGDALVNPAFRRQGIATALHHTSVNGMKDAGIQWLHGFPNAKNLGAFLKVGAIHPGNLHGMYLQIRRGGRLAKQLRLSNSAARGVSNLISKVSLTATGRNLRQYRQLEQKIKDTTSFDSRFDRLTEEVGSGKAIYGVRDSAYLEWRYLRNPAMSHTILAHEDEDQLRGFVALEFTQNKCYIVDIFARSDADSINPLIAGVIQTAIKKHVNVSLPMITAASPFVKHLAHWGFKPGPMEFSFMILPSWDEGCQYVSDINNWHLSYADHDIEAISLTQ